MRSWIIIAVLCLSLGSGVYAQDAILNAVVEIENDFTTKGDVLTEISAKTGLTFSYSQDLPVWDTIHSLVNNKQTAKEFLIELFGERIQCKIINKKVVLKILQPESDKGTIVQGTVIDAITERPLFGATIRLKDSKPLVGTTTDFEGKYALVLNNASSLDTVIISHLGYDSYMLGVTESCRDKVYKLVSRSMDLQEVLVKWNDPKELLIRALKAAGDNYPDKPSQLRVFYRESLKRNNKYMLYVEGLLDVYKSNYRSAFSQDQARLLQLRKFTNIQSNDTILFKLQGGVDAVLDLDLLRNPLSFLALYGLANYEYTYEGVDLIEEKNTYKIGFEPNINNPYRDYTGTIYIDQQSMAIIKVTFDLTKEILEKLGYSIVTKSKPKVFVMPISIGYSVDYKQDNGRYYVNHVSGDMLLKVKHRRKILSSRYKIQFEMVTTDITTTAVTKFKKKQKVLSRQILTDLRGSYLDDLNENWDIGTSILPEKDLEKALRKFRVEELTFEDKN